MGGSSSKSSSDTTNQTTSASNTETNNSSIQDNEGLAFSNSTGNNVSILDEGAIETSFKFASDSQALFGQTFEGVLGLAEKSLDGQKDIINSLSDNTVSENTGGTSKILLPLVVVAGLSLIAYKMVS